MSVTYPLVQLVDTPDTSARVRFDFNRAELSWPATDALANTYTAHEGFTLGVPPLLGDPGGVGAEYGYRTVTLTVVVDGNEAQALNLQSQLARQLLREENYLYFRLSATSEPMWLRCVRSSPGEMSMAEVYRDRVRNQWVIGVQLVADPFAVGRQQTITMNVSNDPGSNNGLFGVVRMLPPIIGDAPAPVWVETAPGNTTWTRPLLNICATDRDWSWRPVWHCSGGVGDPASEASAPSYGPATVVNTSDATASYPNRSVVYTITAAHDWRRQVTLRIVPPFAGRYRLFARVRYIVSRLTATKVKVRGAGATVAAPVETELTPYAGWELADLGTFTFPKGNVPSARPYALGSNEVGIEVNVGAVDFSTAYSLRFDYVLAVPVDLPLDQVGPPTTLAFRQPDRTAGDVTLRINGEVERVEEIRDGVNRVATPEVPVGGYPTVVPGAVNMLTWMTRRMQTPLYPQDQVGEVTAMTLRYRPRYLWMAS